MMSATSVDRTKFEDQVLNSAQPVLVDFWAPWCGPCRAMSSVVDQVAAKVEGRAGVVKVNVDENPNSPAELGVRGIPALFLFKDGQVVSNKTGAAPKAALAGWIDENL